ncbi:hypothetical protein [Zestomonas insulae]|nr:hypothetical protein [Pseudomonas insulae]
MTCAPAGTGSLLGVARQHLRTQGIGSGRGEGAAGQAEHGHG